MNEVTLTALISGAFGLLGVLVTVFGGKRLEREVDEHPDVVAEAAILRQGIVRHVMDCEKPRDLLELLRQTAP